MENSRQYVGQRYVPKIMGEWDKSETYEGLSIVTNEGNSYTSKKRVPIGIDITNEDYWVVTGNYNAQIENYRQEVNKNSEDLNDYKVEVTEQFAQTKKKIPRKLITDFDHLVQNDDWTLALQETIKSALNAQLLGVHYEVHIPNGVFKVKDSVLSNIDVLGKRGLKFSGVSPYSSVLLLDTENRESWFYNNGVNNHKFDRVTFENIGFTSTDSTNANGFRIWSEGGEKQFTFINCAWGSHVATAANITGGMNNLFRFEGSGNADLNKFFGGVFDCDGDVFTFNNNQSVCIETYGTDTFCRGHIVNVLANGGGSYHQYGGSCVLQEKTGNTEPKYVLNIANNALVAQGNGEFNFYGVRYEFRNVNRRIVKSTGVTTGLLKVLFSGCQWGTVHGGSRPVIEIDARKSVKFDNCILDQNFTYNLLGTAINQSSPPFGGLLLFESCDVGTSSLTALYDRITFEGNIGRAIARNCTSRGSKDIQGIRTEDFDLGWQNASPREPSVTTKTISFKPSWRPFPLPSGDYEATIDIPKDTVIKSIYINRPSGSSSQLYKIHVGSSDKTVIYGSSDQTQENENHIIKVENAFINTGEVRVLRLWATGEVDGSRIGGLAFIEYY